MQDQLLDILTATRVDILLDVRAVPQSRKPGFSKTILSASCLGRNISYIHSKSLGTPKTGRQAARAGRVREMEAIFSAHMATPPAQLALADALGVAVRAPTCLLCFERDPYACHRRIVCEAIAARTGQRIVHLQADGMQPRR